MNFVLHTRELGAVCFGAILLKPLTNCMSMMSFCIVYVVDDSKMDIFRTVLGLYLVIIGCALFPNDWYELVCQLCLFLLVPVCVTVQKFATLTQASQARLGEINRELHLCLFKHLARAGSFGFGRQTILLRRVCLA